MYNIKNPHDKNDESNGGINILRWNAHESLKLLIQAYPFADNSCIGGCDSVYEAIEDLSNYCECPTPTHAELSELFPDFYGK